MSLDRVNLFHSFYHTASHCFRSVASPANPASLSCSSVSFSSVIPLLPLLQLFLSKQESRVSLLAPTLIQDMASESIFQSCSELSFLSYFPGRSRVNEQCLSHLATSVLQQEHFASSAPLFAVLSRAEKQYEFLKVHLLHHCPELI